MRDGVMARNLRRGRLLLLALAVFVLGMLAAFGVVRHLLAANARPAGPNPAHIAQGERLRDVMAELSALADAFHARAPRKGEGQAGPNARWIAQELRPRINHFRLRLEDPYAAASLPDALRAPLREAAEALGRAGAAPHDAGRAAHALDRVKEVVRQSEAWIEAHGVGRYLHTPARLPSY